MDISEFSIKPSDYAWYVPHQGAAPSGQPSYKCPWQSGMDGIDSSGKAAKGAAAGKGAGKAGNGKNNDPSQKCLICKRPGHKRRQCWFKDEKDPNHPGKTKGQVLDAKGGGKGKGKTGKGEKQHRRTGVKS